MKHFVLIISLSMLSSLAHAQLAVGGKAGVNIANLAANQPIGAEIQESKIGFNVGAVGSLGIGSSGKLFGVGELNFNQKGGKNGVSGTNSLGYLELTALLRYTIGFGEKVPFKLFFNAGPYFGIKTGRKADIAAYNSNIAEFGLSGGGGIMVPVGNGNIFVEARYSFAVTNLVPQTFERNRVTSISIGYLYTLKGKTEEAKDKGVQGGFE
jgi:hypothetical protein